MKDIWTYDSANRALVDENGLRVASEVGPQDAGLILSARAGLVALSGPAFEGPNRTPFDLTFIQSALDGGCAPDPLDDYASQERPQDAKPRPLWLVLDSMLRYEADQFDGDPATDLSVSGADLVDAFTQWRLEIKAALKASPAFNVYDRGYSDGFADGVEEWTDPDTGAPVAR